MQESKRILIIEDDHNIASLERDYLEANGFTVETAFDGTQGRRMALDGGWACIVLDLMLPNTDGFTICRAVREQSDVPILMVSAKREEVDKIRGLGLGADDYLVKPFSPSELVARVKAHIARFERLTAGSRREEVRRQIEAGGLSIDLDARRVFVDGREVTLTNKEFDLLAFLAQNPNIVFSKDTLLDRIWGYDAIGETSTVTVHVNRIREKIEPEMAQPRYIETVWGAGYRFHL